MTSGVTAGEFAAMCQEHMPESSPTKFSRDSAEPFLDRCCDLGLVRRENTNGAIRYYPTGALTRAFAMWGVPDG